MPSTFTLLIAFFLNYMHIIETSGRYFYWATCTASSMMHANWIIKQGWDSEKQRNKFRRRDGKRKHISAVTPASRIWWPKNLVWNEDLTTKLVLGNNVRLRYLLYISMVLSMVGQNGKFLGIWTHSGKERIITEICFDENWKIFIVIYDNVNCNSTSNF